MKRKWTEEERKYLIENYGKIPAIKIGQKLNKRKGTVLAYARRMGISAKDGTTQEKIMFEKEKHLCWKCKHAVNKPVVVQIVKGKPKMVEKCPWADRLEPVKGWETITVGYRGGIKNDDNCDKTERFAVIKCPLYEAG